MLKFKKINSGEKSRIQKIFLSYSHSFPADERRNETQFIAVFHQEKAKVFSIENEGEMVGYLVTWDLENSVFIEHFEIFEEFRNKKLGSFVLSEFSKLFPKLSLESEPDTLSEIAKRRIGFYERNGFVVVKKDYQQPAYDKDKNDIPLFLMCNYSLKNTDKLVRNIYKIVYGK